MDTIEIPPGSRACLNCGKPLLGDHCYACGQPVKGLVRQFSSIIGDTLDSLFEYDSRTLRTIGPLLFKPGHLSNEYFAGHRVRYVSPVRLFVFLCVVSFFVLQFAIDTSVVRDDSTPAPFASVQTAADVERERAAADAALQAALQSAAGDRAARARERIQRQRERLHERADQHIEWIRLRDEALRAGLLPPPRPDATPATEPGSIMFNGRAWDPETNPVHLDVLPDAVNAWLNAMTARAQANIARVQENPTLLVDTFMQTLPQTLFVLVPLFALLLKFAYLFKRRLYMEHLIVALHSHAFLCFALLILAALSSLRDLFAPGVVYQAIGYAELALAAWMPIYLFVMQKRVYRQGWIMTTLKFAVLGICYAVLLGVGAVINLMMNLVAL